MVTKLVGLKEFRQNIASYTREANVNKIRIIVMKKNIPVLDIRGIDEKEFMFDTLAADVAEARKDIKNGRVLSQEDILKEFGLA